MENELEKLAEAAHDIWSKWMRYMLLQKCIKEERLENGDWFETGNLIIPKELVERWSRQMNTPYSELTESEKESDRDIVRQFLQEFIYAK